MPTRSGKKYKSPEYKKGDKVNVGEIVRWKNGVLARKLKNGRFRIVQGASKEYLNKIRKDKRVRRKCKKGHRRSPKTKKCILKKEKAKKMKEEAEKLLAEAEKLLEESN